ncbi:hypothetical protein CBL_13057 [Carabus blaptoides fortunei]
MFHCVIGDVLPVKLRQESTNDIPTNTTMETSEGVQYTLYSVIKSQIKMEHGWKKTSSHTALAVALLDAGIKYRTVNFTMIPTQSFSTSPSFLRPLASIHAVFRSSNHYTF